MSRLYYCLNKHQRYQEKFDDTKNGNQNIKLKKDRQYNGQKDRQYNGQKDRQYNGQKEKKDKNKKYEE